MNNADIARKLNEYADYLESEEPNIHRVRAYRRAAQTIFALDRPASELLAEKGCAGLDELPGVGASLAYTIEGLIRTGEFHTLRPAGGHIDPERLLTSLPGVGPRLARVLHERLGVSSLEQLERAAHDGRLTQAGVGPKRLRGLIDALAGRLARTRLPEPVRGEPSVDELLTGGRRVSPAGGRKQPAHADAETFQPGKRAVAAVVQHRLRRLAFPRPVLEHGFGAPPEPDARLGGDLVPRRLHVGSAHRGDGDGRRPARPARGAGTGTGVPGVLQRHEPFTNGIRGSLETTRKWFH